MYVRATVVIKEMKDREMKRFLRGKRQTPSARPSQHVPITAALKQRPAKTLLSGPSREQEETRKEIKKRGEKQRGAWPGKHMGRKGERRRRKLDRGKERERERRLKG